MILIGLSGKSNHSLHRLHRLTAISEFIVDDSLPPEQESLREAAILVVVLHCLLDHSKSRSIVPLISVDSGNKKIRIDVLRILLDILVSEFPCFLRVTSLVEDVDCLVKLVVVWAF